MRMSMAPAATCNSVVVQKARRYQVRAKNSWKMAMPAKPATEPTAADQDR